MILSELRKHLDMLKEIEYKSSDKKLDELINPILVKNVYQLYDEIQTVTNDFSVEAWRTFTHDELNEYQLLLDELEDLVSEEYGPNMQIYHMIRLLHNYLLMNETNFSPDYFKKY